MHTSVHTCASPEDIGRRWCKQGANVTNCPSTSRSAISTPRSQRSASASEEESEGEAKGRESPDCSLMAMRCTVLIPCSLPALPPHRFRINAEHGRGRRTEDAGRMKERRRKKERKKKRR
eukprot:2754480-Rhodomonas_salina.1